MTDLGQRLIDYVYERMQIDEHWAVREPQRFTWWAGALAQRVWTDAPREMQGVVVTQVHIETDLLGNVAPSAEALERLAGINRLSTLSAYVADTDARAVRLHASVSATEDNLPLARMLALHATALQVADAHAEAGPLAQIFGADVDASSHPTSGVRDEEDEMLGVPEVYASRGEGASPFRIDELAELVRLEPRPWTTASNTLTGIDAELPFDGHQPSRLELDAEFRHPALGSGLRLALTLPVSATPARVQSLNAGEVVTPDAHQLGGWCASEDDQLEFVSFIPTAAYVPNLARALVYHMSARNGWAHQMITVS
jgi:hypothetical protein